MRSPHRIDAKCVLLLQTAGMANASRCGIDDERYHAPCARAELLSSDGSRETSPCVVDLDPSQQVL